MAGEQTCNLQPFLAKAVPSRVSPEQAASAVQLIVQQLENWLRRFKDAICADLQTPPSGVTRFLELSDAPHSYAGQAGNFVRVNAGATALEFFNLIATLVTTFLQLSDTPGSYAGAALQGVRVNAAETALEFFNRLFTTLTDVPTSYAGAAGALVAVNAAENGLEFSTSTGTSLSRILTTLTRGAFLSSGAGAVGWGNNFTVVIDSATQTVAHPTTTSLATSFERVTETSANAQNRAAGVRHSSNTWFRGNAAQHGGFRMRARIATTTAVANQRAFFGYYGFAGADFTLTQNPSQQINIIGFGYDSAEAVWSFIHNDGAGAATKISLGASFPVDNASVYDIEISAEPNGGSVEYTITNVGTGATAGGSVSTEIPASTQLLMPYFWLNSGTGGTAVVMCIIHFYQGLFGG